MRLQKLCTRVIAIMNENIHSEQHEDLFWYTQAHNDGYKANKHVQAKRKHPQLTRIGKQSSEKKLMRPVAC